jgi:hypothetical protein
MSPIGMMAGAQGSVCFYQDSKSETLRYVAALWTITMRVAMGEMGVLSTSDVVVRHAVKSWWAQMESAGLWWQRY